MDTSGAGRNDITKAMSEAVFNELPIEIQPVAPTSEREELKDTGLEKSYTLRLLREKLLMRMIDKKLTAEEVPAMVERFKAHQQEQRRVPPSEVTTPEGEDRELYLLYASFNNQARLNGYHGYKGVTNRDSAENLVEADRQAVEAVVKLADDVGERLDSDDGIVQVVIDRVRMDTYLAGGWRAGEIMDDRARGLLAEVYKFYYDWGGYDKSIVTTDEKGEPVDYVSFGELVVDKLYRKIMYDQDGKPMFALSNPALKSVEQVLDQVKDGQAEMNADQLVNFIGVVDGMNRLRGKNWEELWSTDDWEDPTKRQIIGNENYVHSEVLEGALAELFDAWVDSSEDETRAITVTPELKMILEQRLKAWVVMEKRDERSKKMLEMKIKAGAPIEKVRGGLRSAYERLRQRTKNPA